MQGKVLQFIFNLYKKAKSCVVSNGRQSDLFSCRVGVCQGENLSPILFALYLKDLESFLKLHMNNLTIINEAVGSLPDQMVLESLIKMFILLYADDTTLLADSPQGLQKGLDYMSTYCDNWDLKVNVDKTKIVIFSRGKVKKLPTLLYKGTPVEIVYDTMFLSALFNYNGKFNKTIARNCVQGTKAMFALINRSRQLHLSVDLQMHL